MKVIKEAWSEMDYKEKVKTIEGLVAWGSLLFLGFMIAVIGG